MAKLEMQSSSVDSVAGIGRDFLFSYLKVGRYAFLQSCCLVLRGDKSCCRDDQGLPMRMTCRGE